jgi:uncharacterized protein
LVTRRALRRHQRILIDSSVWVYHFEQHAEFGPAAASVIQAMEEGAFRGIASELTLLELTVKPLQLGRQDIADEYEVLLSYFPNLQLEPIGREVLLAAAALRARHGLRTPDAILLATGVHSGASAAVTDDDAWVGAAPASMDIILLSGLT